MMGLVSACLDCFFVLLCVFVDLVRFVRVFFLLGKKCHSFKSNSSSLVISVMCVELDIEDTYSIKNDIKCSS